MHLSPNARINFCGRGGVRRVHNRTFGLHFDDLGLTTEAEDRPSLRPSPASRSELGARVPFPARRADWTLACMFFPTVSSSPSVAVEPRELRLR